MPSPTSPHKNSPLHLSLPKPAFQREYTTTPSHWRACTPKTHHGFIALHNLTPEHTPNSYEHQTATANYDYFSTRKKEPILSPDPAPYEAHGFLPLCSVAAARDHAKDYFSVRDSQATAAVEASFEGFDTSAPGVADTSRTVSEPPPCFHGYVSTSHLSLSELAHPSGSPIHERDMMYPRERFQDSDDDDVSVLRGGGGEDVYEKEQESAEVLPGEEEHPSSAISTFGYSSHDTDKSVEPPKSVRDESRLPSVTTKPIEESANVVNPSMKLDPEIEALLLEIAAAFPNASVLSSSAHASGNNDINTALKNNDMDNGAVTDDPPPTHSFCQSKHTQATSPDVPLGDSQTVKPLPVLDFDNLPTDSTMDNPEIGKILPKPLSPRPSTPSARSLKKKKPYKPLSPINSNSGGLFDIVQRSTAKEIALCRSGTRTNIVNATTGEVYVRDVPMRMLWHFCGASALERFTLGDEERADILKIPAEQAEKGGIAKVIRYMRRACTGCIVRPTGELRIPSFGAGIETIRACRVFGLEADARRIEELIIHTWMGSKEWYMTDEHVELIWDGYYGLLRETALGDAIVWFVLNEVQTGTHPLAEEIRWMLDQEEYESLKERVHSENLGIQKRWRHKSREEFLERCRVEREQKRREEEERTGVHPRQKEPRRLQSDIKRTQVSHRGSGRQRSDSIRSSGLLDDETTESDVQAPSASQTSTLRRRSSNSRAGADTPRPTSLAETDSWTEVSPTAARASPVPADAQSVLWSHDARHTLRGNKEDAASVPKQRLSFIRRLEKRIDR